MSKKNNDTNDMPDIEMELEQSAPDEETPEEQEKSELELLEEKFAELNERYIRLMAEYDNFRKRSQKERDDIYPNATAAALAKFLPVLDNFERAAVFEHPDDDFGKGFDMIYQSFLETLKSMGVEEIGVPGETFDPAVHNAVMHIEDENLGENVVATVMQKGYKIGDKIIRYAMVQTAN